MYFVIESYVDEDENGVEHGYILPAHTETELLQAESRYHTILGVAAVSEHKYHGAIVFDGTMEPIIHHGYAHIKEE